MPSDNQSFDYIVVGGGSAGCVLASRLSDDPARRVLLIEAGGPDRSAMISTPGASMAVAYDAKVGWGYMTEPQPGMNGRQLSLIQAKVLGGGSSINGMTHTRGFAADYDDWARAGAEGWDYAHVLPYFRRLEASARRGSPYRGADGPIGVTTGFSPLPIVQRLLDALAQSGQPILDDLNVPDPEGFGYYDWTVAKGRRASTSASYPGIRRRRPNLTVLTDAMALRVVVENGRAVAVELGVGRERRTVRAAQEVVLCAGAIGSPRLLQLSGVGPAAALREIGVPVVADLPHVGAHLQNHLSYLIEFGINEPISAFRYMKPWTGALETLRYLVARRGFLANGPAAAGGFFRSSPAAERADMQLFLIPALVEGASKAGKLPTRDGFSMMINTGLPHSEGEVTLRSADPLEPPRIDPRYFSDARDVDAMVSSVEMLRELVQQPALRSLVDAFVTPGPDVKSRAELEAHVRARADNYYHVAGTCRMGAGPEDSVTDPQLRVHGIEGLRVADASVMPRLVNGNTNAPVVMIAERAADLILGVGVQDPAQTRTSPDRAAKAAA